MPAPSYATTKSSLLIPSSVICIANCSADGTMCGYGELVSHTALMSKNCASSMRAARYSRWPSLDERANGNRHEIDLFECLCCEESFVPIGSWHVPTAIKQLEPWLLGKHQCSKHAARQQACTSVISACMHRR